MVLKFCEWLNVIFVGLFTHSNNGHYLAILCMGKFDVEKFFLGNFSVSGGGVLKQFFCFPVIASIEEDKKVKVQ